VDPGVVVPRRPFERLHGFRQLDASGARFLAAAENLRVATAAMRFHVETARGRRHLAEKYGRRARVVLQLDLRVAVKTSDDLVVVQLHRRAPEVNHLRELREREAP
jgi:uncharacterized tellurite resistance protein B-like protein